MVIREIWHASGTSLRYFAGCWPGVRVLLVHSRRPQGPGKETPVTVGGHSRPASGVKRQCVSMPRRTSCASGSSKPHAVCHAGFLASVTDTCDRIAGEAVGTSVTEPRQRAVRPLVGYTARAGCELGAVASSFILDKPASALRRHYSVSTTKCPFVKVHTFHFPPSCCIWNE